MVLEILKGYYLIKQFVTYYEKKERNYRIKEGQIRHRS
jgi:hypothetical protein